MRAIKRLGLLLLCCAPLLLGGCAVVGLQGEPGASAPNLGLLSMAPYDDEELIPTSDTDEGHVRVDLWLEASQVMGGVNPYEKSLYPHTGRKYREGGFHYRYENKVGMYENVLRDMLSAAEGSRVRVLRFGNERLPDRYLSQSGLAHADASADQLRSLRRDLLTYAVDPMPTLFSDFSAEDMSGSFYTLGTPKLNQTARFSADNGAQLENPGLVEQMSAALDGQIAAIASGAPEGLAAERSDTDYPLLYALQNIDLSRLSVITCDPASLRRLGGVASDGSPIPYVEQALRERGIFDSGLSVGLYAFTLDYMGQMTSFGAADFSEPLLWGRLKYNTRKRISEDALPMPRILLTLVIGTPPQVDRFTAALNARLESDGALKGLRGPEDGELTYMANDQTVAQRPFAFSYRYTAVQRPSVGYYTQHTPGADIAVTRGEGSVSGSDSLRTVTFSSKGGQRQDRTLTLTFPTRRLDENVTADLSQLQYARVDVVSALLLSEELPNTSDARPADGAQVIALRDTLYVFTHRDRPFADDPTQNPFTLRSLSLDGRTLTALVDVDGAKLQAGYYRLRVVADISGEQLTWSPVAWIDGGESLGVSISNEQIAQWESFTALMAQFDRDTQNVPKQFQHAWGPVPARSYHGMAIPDFPPVYRAPGLAELFSQLRSAANVEESPYVRCVFDVFVAGGANLPQ